MLAGVPSDIAENGTTTGALRRCRTWFPPCDTASSLREPCSWSSFFEEPVMEPSEAEAPPRTDIEDHETVYRNFVRGTTYVAIAIPILLMVLLYWTR